jgi:hypothetical protein
MISRYGNKRLRGLAAIRTLKYDFSQVAIIMSGK